MDPEGEGKVDDTARQCSDCIISKRTKMPHGFSPSDQQEGVKWREERDASGR